MIKPNKHLLLHVSHVQYQVHTVLQVLLLIQQNVQLVLSALILLHKHHVLLVIIAQKVLLHNNHVQKVLTVQHLHQL